MTPEEQEIEVRKIVEETVVPPMRLLTDFSAKLLKLILDQGSSRMKREAVDLALDHQSRMQELS